MSTRLSPIAKRSVWANVPSSDSDAVDSGSEVVVEREGVPGEVAARTQRRRHSLEEATACRPGGHVQQRPKGADDEGCGLVELELDHVAELEDQLYSGRVGTASRLLEHGRRGVHADDRRAGCQGDRDGHPAAADGQFDDRTARLDGEPNVEVDVLGDSGCPVVVAGRELLGPRHRPTVRAP